VRTRLLFLMLGLLWGSTWLLHAQPRAEAPLLAAGAVRFALAALLLGTIAWIRRAGTGKKTQSGGSFWQISAVLGLLLLALPYACSAGASHADVAAGLPEAIYAAMPLAVVLLLGEEMNPWLPALLLGFSGVSLLVIQGLQVDLAHWRGEALLAAGMVANAAALAYAARGRLTVAASLEGCAAQCAAAAGILAVFAGISGQADRLLHAGASLRAAEWLPISVEALITALTLPMMYALLRRSGAISTAAVQWLVTLAGAVEAAVLLGFQPIWENWTGVLLTLLATGMVLRQIRDQSQGQPE